MILFFENFFSSAMTSYSMRMLLAALTSLIVTILCGPRFIKKLYELRIGQSIRMEECPMLGELHKKKQDTPTMGGILILFSMLLSLLLWMDLTSIFTLILLVATLVLGCVGGYDDYLKLKYRNAKGLSGRKKMLIQGSLATCLALYLLVPSFQDLLFHGSFFHPPVAKTLGETLTSKAYATNFYLPFVQHPALSFSGAGLIIAFLGYFFVTVGSSNAVNLTDGLDGLAAGCLLFVSVVFASVAFLSNNFELSNYLNLMYIEGSGEIAVYLSAMFGACLGFLWFNSHPAQVFMGDIGSLTLGGILGVSAILLRKEGLLALVGGVFVAEALSVILQVGSYKLRNKKRIFLCAPLHHHFEYKGLPETKVVVRFWIVGLILAIIGMFSLKISVL